MRIGIDGYGAVSRGADAQRVLAEALAQYGRGKDEFVVYTPELRDDPGLQRLRTLGNVEMRVPAPQSFRGRMWRLFGIPSHLRADGVELYLGLGGELPLNITGAGVPAAVVLDDLTFLSSPGSLNAFTRRRLEFLTRHACRSAARVIVRTAVDRDLLTDALHLDRARISVIPPLCAAEFYKDAARRQGFPERYILLTDDVRSARNGETAIKALLNISPDISLVIAGNADKTSRKRLKNLAGNMELGNRVIFADELPHSSSDDPWRASLYRNAEAALSLSHCCVDERMLAAMASGTPLVAAATPGKEEMCGPDTLYVNPADPSEIVENIHAILCDPAAARRMGEDTRDYARRYEAPAVARTLLDLCHTL